MALVEVSVTPVGTNSPDMKEAVLAACKVAGEKGIKYQINPVGTVLEGDLDQLLDTVKAMHQAAFVGGAQRVVTNIHVDDRHDKSQTMVAAVEEIGKHVKPMHELYQ